MEIIVLGTSSMVPTKDRNHTSLLLLYKNEGILFDCGEGTQRQLTYAGIKPSKITKIVISHWHGDHILGLPGLLQTMGANDYSNTLEVFGPKGTKKMIANMYKAFIFENKLKLKITEVKNGIFNKTDDYELEAQLLDHGIPCYGYAFIEKDKRKIDVEAVKKLGIPEGPLLGKLVENKSIKFNGKIISPKNTTYLQSGKKVSFIFDTSLCKGCYIIAKDADLLFCESTYASNLEQKSEDYKHMTAKNAGLIANSANAKKLVLFHFSARYKSPNELEEDAKNVFHNTIAAHDLMKFSL